MTRFSSITITSSFPALKHRNFRLFWIGQCFSLIGTWMQNIGQSWLVWELTHSAMKLSIITMVQFLPMMLLSIPFGTLIDKFPKKKMLIFTQSAMMILALVLASLTYFKVVEYWHLIVLGILLGFVNTLDMPTRQAYMSEIVEKKDLMNAVALNSSIYNLARIIGPGIAGIMIGAFGIAICFYLNALSFLAVIAGILMINAPVVALVRRGKRLFTGSYTQSVEGLVYIFRKRTLLMPLLLLAFVTIFLMNFNNIIPVFAANELQLDASGYGLLMTIMGIGSFTGAMTVAMKHKAGPKTSYQLASAIGTSFFMILLGLTKIIPLIWILLVIIGFSSTVFVAMINSALQLNSEDHMRGRVMSIYSMVFVGFIPFGSLYSGYLMELFGASGCMVISGIIGTVASLSVILLRNKTQTDLKAAQ